MRQHSSLEKVLHRLALGSDAVAETMLDADLRISRPDADAVRDQRHVFIAGLARSGTTILLRRLAETGAFASLVYRDMPFVIAPRLWRRIRGSARKSDEAEERAHGDGLLVSADSPEALDEVFWRVACGRDYIRSDRLICHMPSEEMIERYRAYVALALPPGHGRYLSKNNNNILRLPAIRQAFPNAEILMPFRDPLAQAASLLRQHRRFVERHAEDPFARTYMGWLVHHEFGGDHRPFDLGEGPPAGDPDDLNYWLETWVRVYGWLERNAPPGARFVGHERLCSEPAAWNRLAAELGVSAETEEAHRPGSTQSRETAEVNPQLLDQAYEIHARLEDRARGAHD